ncbi:hypothetical protein [Rodentibacter trehalosifermentans]|uniref:hypothetical protein n=1 Tax=Rodentibacter trehalosifermentans TaxID=1908263 RepID=UPI0009863E1C|nr:hypothetical protein [Rodentibacter trehalosifermentans]OOF47570.1 hypothetical protein BKK53_11175 [Rodentibacter trehalosifermentans]
MPYNAETISKPDIEKDHTIEELQAKITELENQLQAQQSAVNSQEVLPVSNLDENYNPTERDTHLLIIGALANLLAKPIQNKSRYLKGTGAINQSAINKDIETEIAELLKPSTKERSAETIKPRLREALKLVKQAD